MTNTSVNFNYVLSPGLDVLWVFSSLNFHSNLMRKALSIYK